MANSKTPDTLTAIASLSQASNLPPSKPPETDGTKPGPWQAPQLVAASDEDFDEIP